LKIWGRAYKEAVKRLTGKPYTIHYPFVDVKAFKGYRGRISLQINKCIGCGLCSRVCPANAIEMVPDERVKPAGKRPHFKLPECCYCALCAEYCPKEAIELTTDYHLYGFKKEDVVAEVKSE
jgi:NADH-quinone oxidoreductase subunit I